jgi:hypothetical protein
LNQFATVGKESCSNRKCELLCGLKLMDIFVGVDTFFKSEMSKCKLQSSEAFLNLKCTTSLKCPE